jgi:hypothetical protein
MHYNDAFIDSFDKDMLTFMESDDYKYQHTANNRMIQSFRSTLSPEQQTQFNRLLNRLSDEYSDIALAAYECGYQKTQ